MLITIAKDLLSVTTGVIGHQVNCRGKMGSGVAKQIRIAYPKVFEAYNSLCESVQELDRYTLLGKAQITSANEDNSLIVANIFGQLATSKTTRETEYCALHHGIIDMLNNVPPEYPIHLPFFIGCGRGGGDWNIVHNILTRISKESNRTLFLYKYEPPQDA